MKAAFITEGSSTIGFGHITRCSSIYQALQEQGVRCEFIINGDNSIQKFIKGIDYKLINYIDRFNVLERYLQKEKFDYIIIDSYLLSEPQYEMLYKKDSKFIYVDDSNRINYPPGIIVNGSIYGKDLNYNLTDSEHSYLLGPEYSHIRKAFWDVSYKIIYDNVQSILITIGSSDFRNVTPEILQFISMKYPKLKKRVIVGTGTEKLHEIRSVSDNNTIIIQNASAEEMKENMISSDIAISGGGQTTYELARVGVPGILISVVGNQEENVSAWEKLGIFKNAGKYNDSELLKNIEKSIYDLRSKQKRLDQQRESSKIIDGQGARRIARYLTNDIVSK